MKNKIKLKNGIEFNKIQLLLYRPNLGDTAVVFIDLNTKEKHIIPLKEMESFITERAIYKDNTYHDIDQLQKAKEADFDENNTVWSLCYGPYTINETDTLRTIVSEKYNSVFNKKTGIQKKWGSSISEKVKTSPWGPEIVNFDLNTENEEYVTLKNVKKMVYILPRTVNYINLYLDDLTTNPEFSEIVKFLTYNPYHTVHINLFTKAANHSLEQLSEYIDYISIVNVTIDSENKKAGYCFVSDLNELGIKNVNIIKELYEESYNDCLTFLDDLCEDLSLVGVKNIVFSVPKENTINKSYILDLNKYAYIFNKAIEQEIEINISPCLVPIFKYFVQDEFVYRGLFSVPEACECSLFSVYIDAHFNIYPCKSFKNSNYMKNLNSPDTESLEKINVLALRDHNIFLRSAWQHTYFESFRISLGSTLYHKDALVSGVRHCPTLPMYPVIEKDLGENLTEISDDENLEKQEG